MSALRQPVENTESENGYRFLRIASERFDTALKDLTDAQWKEVRKIALLETQLEIAVLSSKEASQVAVPDSHLMEALGQVKDRFTDDDEYEQILENINMSEEELQMQVIKQTCIGFADGGFTTGHQIHHGLNTQAA